MEAAAVQAQALQKLTRASLQPEYFDIVDGISLLPVPTRAGQQFYRGLRRRLSRRSTAD